MFGEKKMKNKSEQNETAEDVAPLSPAWRREIKRRMADADNPVRFAVFSDICGNGRWRLWLDISGDGYGMSIDQATLFKREHVARCVAKAYSKGRRNDLMIATVTTKNKKIKVLKYEKRKHRTMA